MTSARQNQLANKRQLLKWIAEIDRVCHEVAISGTASASLSAGGGSQSYTHADIDKLMKLRVRYMARLKQINMALAAWPNNTGIRHVVTVRSGVAWH